MSDEKDKCLINCYQLLSYFEDWYDLTIEECDNIIDVKKEIDLILTEEVKTRLNKGK